MKKNILIFLLILVLSETYSLGCPSGLCEQPTCPNGYRFNGTTCVLADSNGYTNTQQYSANCPPGSQWNGNNCVMYKDQATYACPDGYTFDGANCILSSANGRIGGNLAQDLKSQIHGYITGSINSITNKAMNCPADSYWNGTSCVTNSGRCPTGYIWNGMACVTSAQTMPGPSYTPTIIGPSYPFTQTINTPQLPTFPTTINSQITPIYSTFATGFNNQNTQSFNTFPNTLPNIQPSLPSTYTQTFS